jgi:hypothetical protein
MSAKFRSERDRTLARLLALGLTQTVAAAEVGISDRTVRRRLTDPAFIQLIDDERVRLSEQILDGLVIASRAAVRRLHQLVDDDDQPATVHVAAARALLQATTTWRPQVEFEQRLHALEAVDVARVRGLRAVT